MLSEAELDRIEVVAKKLDASHCGDITSWVELIETAREGLRLNRIAHGVAKAVDDVNEARLRLERSRVSINRDDNRCAKSRMRLTQHELEVLANRLKAELEGRSKVKESPAASPARTEGIVWTGDLDKECTATWRGMIANAEAMDDLIWDCSVGVIDGEEELMHSCTDGFTPTTGVAARQICESFMRSHDLARSLPADGLMADYVASFAAAYPDYAVISNLAFEALANRANGAKS